MTSDDDWVLDADWPSDPLIVDTDWVLADDIPNSPPRRNLTGFFLINNNHHTYIPLFVPSTATNLISTIPISASICASTRAFVLARAPWSSYYIYTPTSHKWSRLPNPIHSHHNSIPTALIITDTHKFHFFCAVPLPDAPPGFYRIEIFDSWTGKWRIGPDRFPIGNIVPSSGVSCGGAVYFRTETPSVVVYDDASGVVRILPPPPRCWGEEVKWELAEAKGQILCVCVRGRVVEVYQLEEKDRWVLLVKLEEIVCGDLPRPLRVQNGGFSVVLWVDGRIGRWDLEGGRAAGLWFGEEAPPPGNCVEYVPYCGVMDLRRTGGDRELL